MSRVCEVTGKRPLTGHNVSHSNRKTKMRQIPNLKKKRFFNEETNEWVTLRVSTSAIRTIQKKGVAKVMAEIKANPPVSTGRSKRAPKAKKNR